MTSRYALAISSLLMLMPLAPGARPMPEATTATGQGQASAPASQTPQAKMPDMKKMHEQMMAEMKEENAKLNQLVTQMDAATGQAKVDAIAAVVRELVRTHTTMTERMGKMHQETMAGRMMMNK